MKIGELAGLGLLAVGLVSLLAYAAINESRPAGAPEVPPPATDTSSSEGQPSIEPTPIPELLDLGDCTPPGDADRPTFGHVGGKHIVRYELELAMRSLDGDYAEAHFIVKNHGPEKWFGGWMDCKARDGTTPVNDGRMSVRALDVKSRCASVLRIWTGGAKWETVTCELSELAF